VNVGKHVVLGGHSALISFSRSFLPLVVSVCVWAQQWPEPDKELVEKYEGLKAVFFKRIVTAWEKVKSSAQPSLEGSPTGGRAQEIYDELKKSPRMESAIKIIR